MDVVDLKEFYASPLGQTARRLIAHRIHARWQNMTGNTIVGLGFATPYLGGWTGSATRVIGLMPAWQGVVHWPPGQKSMTALVDEADLPLPNAAANVVLVIHCLEHTYALHAMLQEIWRILAPQGRALFIVPNRRGLWARQDTTPFGHGRPYSRSQLIQLLREENFSPSGWANALFMPPSRRAMFRRSATGIERLGLVAWPAFSGVIMVEAVKQVYASAAHKRVRRLMPAFKPQPASLPAANFQSQRKA